MLKPKLTILAVLLAGAGALACGLTDTQIVDVSGRADSLVVGGRADSTVITGADTTVTAPDTVVREIVDTVFAPADTVIIAVVDTVLGLADTTVVTSVDTIVSGTDTTFVMVVDTLVAVDTVFVTTADTTVAIDTIEVIEVDTIVTVDTVIVERVVDATSELSPSSSALDLAVGETATLTVTAQDPLGGASVPGEVLWISEGPTIASVNSMGRVRGESPGQTNIFAITASLSASIPTTVRIPAPPPGGFFEGFEADGFASRGWYDNTSLTRSTTERHSGSGALRIRFEAGRNAPTFGPASRHFIDETTTVYVSFWVKYSENWESGGHLFQLLTNESGNFTGPAVTNLTTYIEADRNGRPALGITDRANIDQSRAQQDLTGVTEERAAAGCNGNTDGYSTSCFQVDGTWWNDKYWFADDVYFSDSPGPRYKNDWHFIEVFFRLNSIENGIGITDGVAQYWYDGALIMNLQGVLFRTGAHPDMRFRQFIIGPWLGIPANDTQTTWIDDLTVASARP